MGAILRHLTLAALALIALAFQAWAQTATTLPPQLQQDVRSVIDGQIQAFRSGDHEAAFSYAAPGIRHIFGSTERFIGMVKNGYGAIYGARNWSYGRGEASGNVLLQEVMITGPNGRDWIALYTLRKQPDGSWRIAGVQIVQAQAQST